MPIRVKNNSKCNEWERRRRDRLNDAFKNLAQLLPHYDPARIPAKIDILEKSTEFVKELRLSNSRLLSNQVQTDEKCKLIKQLQDEVNRLILRVKQLTILLKKASITIPIGPEIKSLGSKRMKWSGKLKPEDVENATISDGTTTPSGETVPGKVPVILSGAVPNQTPNISSQPSNDIITNSSAINTSVASIIVPLKETNLSNTNGGDNANSKASTSPIVITSATSLVSTSEPTKVTFTSVMTTCSSQSSPIKVFTNSKPIFTTATSTPIQLPLQTFIIAPCPITGSSQALSSQNPQIVTRIANIFSAPIVPKPSDGLPCFKVPIKSLLKPIPKVIKRRKRKKKNETLTPPATNKTSSTINTGTQVQPDKEKITKDDVTSNETVSSTATKPTSSLTDNKNKESVEPEVQTQTASTKLETDNKKDKGEKKSGEEDSSNKNIVENDVPDSETSDLITSNEILPQLSTPVTATSNIEMVPQATKVIDISEDVEVVVEKVNICTEKAEVAAEGSKPVEHISEEQDQDESVTVRVRPADKGTQECDNIPVLRIIEASDEENVVHDNILSTVVVESSSTETISAKEVIDHGTLESKVMEEKDISKEIVEPVSEKPLMEETATISNSNMTAVETNISEIAQIESSSKTRIDDTVKSVCEIPTDNPAQNAESNSDKKQQDMIDNITAADSTKEKINPQKNKDTIATSQVPFSHQKDTTVLGKGQSSITSAPALTECHNLSSICEVPHFNTAAITSIAPAKEYEEPSLSKEMPIAFSQKQTEPRRLESLTPLSEKGLQSVVSLKPSISSTNQREESNKAGASSTHKSIMDTTETVTTDKISECIARSIDLIDANDSELMALGEHWEDSGTSPKSISPTQIFLNIFPLLPRESSISEQHHSQTTHQLSQNPPTSTFQPSSKNSLPYMPSSNSRSSFFIDAMLPDDHPPSTSTEITDPISTSLPSSHSPFLPLTPPQYSSLAPTSQQISSPFSMSSNYYWTPQTIPSSSNADNNFMDYRNTSNVNIFLLDENQRSSVSTNTMSSALTTTSALTPATSIKSSAVPIVSTTSSVTAPILSTAAKTKSKSSENHSSKKRQKTENSLKQAFMADTNLPTFSKDQKTKTPVTTSTSTNITWAGTTAITSSTFQHASTFQQSVAQNVSAVPALESTGHSSSTLASTTSQKTPYHSCSLLDALNPMDASFFRPLINALDSHDFRSLDFPGGNSLPPPPLPPLITPSSTKSLYSSHINPAPQPVQSSSINITSYSNHQHSLIQPNQPIQMFSSNVPLMSSSRSHQAEISSHGSKHQHHNKPMQQFQSLTLSSQQESRPSPSSKATKSQTISVPNSSTEKTSRTSGRQKHESKQVKLGKSSRTQPYVTPSSTSQTTTDQKQSQKQDHNAPNVTPKATRTHSFHTIHSHIHPSTDLSSSSSRNYDFHNIQSQLSNKISNPVKVKPSNSDKTAPVPRIQAPKSAESKTQKSKEPKIQSSNNVKQPSKSLQSNFSIAQQIPTTHSQTSSSVSLRSTSSQASAKVNSAVVHQTNFSRPNLETEISKSTQPIHNIISSVSQPTAQLQQSSSGESISLFPEFSTIGANCNTSRQFAGGQSHAPQYYHHDTSTMQQQPEQPASVSNFPIQRTQPYYFPDISSFENFPAVHHNQGQPQLPLVTQQQVHHPSVSRQAAPESSNNYGQNQSHSDTHGTVSHPTKCTYGSNPSTASNTNQPEFQQAHVQQQPTTRQHHNYFMNQDTYHHNQQPTVQHHPATVVQPSESQRHQPQFPTCQQQVPQQQNRNHAHHPHSNTSTTTTSTTTSVSSGKEKQQHSTPAAPAMAFHSHTTSQQQQQPPHHQQITNHLQQNVPQPANRTSSKTVNWMTDTGYRSNSSANAAASKQQRQSTAGLASTSNPFSVSKLVGNTSGTVPPKLQQVSSTRNASGMANSSKNQQPQSIASHNINVSTHTAATRQNKSSRNNTSSNSSTAGTGTTPVHSQNQSNYCAEALIRKNPPPIAASTNDWMNDFNLVSSTNQNFHGSNYTDGHHHPSSHTHTQHHQNQNTASENFPGSYTSNICGGTGTYHYQASAAPSTPSSNASHFPHFDQVQPQYNMTHHRTHHHHHPQHSVQTSTSSNYDHGQQRLHNGPAHSSQPHDMQINAAGQMHYSQHQHHHHHQIHVSNQHPQTHSSSSSVTNFNLSTIFPEINDKRSTNNSSNSLAAHGGSTSSGNNNNSNAGGSGNINSAFGYQHSSFASSSEGPGNMR